MKFAKQLALRTIQSWSEYYLDYKILKKYIKEKSINYYASNRDPEILKKIIDEFRELLIVELNRVNSRFEQVEAESSDTLDELSVKSYKRGTPEQMDKWRKDMSNLLQTLESLNEFIDTNITGFQKILKKFDKYLSSEALPPESPIANKSHNTSLSIYLSPDTCNTAPDSVEGHPIRIGTVLNKNGHHRYSFTPIGKELWELILKYKFSTSEADEILLSRAKQLWRKRVPLSPIVTPEIEDLSSLSIEDSTIPTINSLDLDALPNGKVSMLWVVLAEDGLNLPIKVPVMVAKGIKPGPIVGLTAALHGNELNGIPLIHRLMSQDLNSSHLHGVVVSVPVANTPGYLAGQRTFSDGQDLNRVMPGKANGSTSQVYAYNLIDRIVSKFTHLIDLHTASKGRVNSLYVRANMNDPRTRRMAKLQNPQIIVHNTSPDGSLRGAAMEKGIPAITVEIGDPSKFQKRFVRTALQGVMNILNSLKMVPNENQQPEYVPVVCARSYWIFAKRGGILNVVPDVNTWVKKNEIIATLHSVFGTLIETYLSPEDGIVIGKEMNPVCQSGQRILHLGVVDDKFQTKVDDGHL